jgi:AraC-like DNA-binding protein
LSVAQRSDTRRRTSEGSGSATSGFPPSILDRGRLRHACRELVQTEAQIAEIARAHGFAEPLYLARRFRTFTGESTSTYRRYRGSLQF